jgi:predicted nucleic acid-binding protein
VTWLLDVSVLVARLVRTHEHQQRVTAWWPGRQLAVCPITELGFLRVTCALGFAMTDARGTLASFLKSESPLFIPCDRRALDSEIVLSARKTTDIYLADLAASRGWRLITLDSGIEHPAAELIPQNIAPSPHPG